MTMPFYLEFDKWVATVPDGFLQEAGASRNDARVAQPVPSTALRPRLDVAAVKILLPSIGMAGYAPPYFSLVVRGVHGQRVKWQILV